MIVCCLRAGDLPRDVESFYLQKYHKIHVRKVGLSLVDRKPPLTAYYCWSMAANSEKVVLRLAFLLAAFRKFSDEFD